jgi:hypothetical protein
MYGFNMHGLIAGFPKASSDSMLTEGGYLDFAMPLIDHLLDLFL